jgi:hypothetical protein
MTIRAVLTGVARRAFVRIGAHLNRMIKNPVGIVKPFFDIIALGVAFGAKIFSMALVAFLRIYFGSGGVIGNPGGRVIHRFHLFQIGVAGVTRLGRIYFVFGIVMAVMAHVFYRIFGAVHGVAVPAFDFFFFKNGDVLFMWVALGDFFHDGFVHLQVTTQIYEQNGQQEYKKQTEPFLFSKFIG